MEHTDPIWAELNHKLPWHRTEEQRQMRIHQWKQIDVNGNGFLSLAEVDKGMRDVIGLPVIFDMKPVMMRAFTAAKNKVKSKSSHGDDYIEKAEYRWLLQYLRQYYEYFIAFERIDKSGDHRLSHTEFLAAKTMIEGWGINMSNPEAQWKACNSDGGAYVLFIEFCDWAIRQKLDLEDDDDENHD